MARAAGEAEEVGGWAAPGGRGPAVVCADVGGTATDTVTARTTGIAAQRDFADRNLDGWRMRDEFPRCGLEQQNTAVSESASEPWYLGIDLGTGGLKVGAVDLAGTVLASAFRSIDTVITDDGGNEQDPFAWFDALASAGREVTTALRAETAGAAGARTCRGIGITGQWGSTIPVDVAGTPVGPCLLWSDRRGAPWSAKLTGGTIGVSGFGVGKIVSWLRFAGGAPSKEGADPTGHVQFLRHRRPEIDSRSACHLEPVDLIGAWLTGIVAATPASMVLSWLTDNRPDAPCAYHPSLLRLADRRASQLPPLRPTGSRLGALLPARARALGLGIASEDMGVDVPVVCGAPDLHTAAIGTGGMACFEGHLAISTSAWVSAPVSFKKTSVKYGMASIPGFTPGSYMIANNQETGGASLRWLRDAVLRADDGLGRAPADYDAVTSAAALAAPGAGGVIFTPWLKGERTPVEDPNLRAAFLNVSISTTRSDLIRAVLEGVAYNARWLLEATESFAGQSLDGLRLFGGGASSDLWAQIHADVIGRPIARIDDAIDVNVRGAAWFAALSLGHRTVDDLRWTPIATTNFVPDPRASATYRPLYGEFTRLAKAQKAMYARLNGVAANHR